MSGSSMGKVRPTLSLAAASPGASACAGEGEGEMTGDRVDGVAGGGVAGVE
mgnify:CR=1 FL=1